MSDVVWAAVRDYDGSYEVSNRGEVRSVSRVVNNRWNAKSPRKGCLLKPGVKREGYLSVALWPRKGRRPRHYVHRLVAEHFIPNPERLAQVNHIDGDKTNNCADNLEWVTASQNCQHAVDNSIYQQARGEALSKYLTEADVVDIRRMVANGAMHKEAAALYGIGRKAVTKIVNRQRWKHVA